MIAQESNVPIMNVGHFVRALAFEENIASALNMSPPSFGPLLQAVAYMGRQKCVHYPEFYIPPTHRVLSIPSEIATGWW